jgi:glyoxylase-like metal-dependent hydrolase (beta-lactamase superfamily II)
MQDGSLVLPIDELFNGFTPEECAGQLPEAREGQVIAPVHVALVQVDGEVILIDTGMGTASGEEGQGGALVPTLAELGLKPEDVTRVVITHTHGDHVGGALARSGEALRPTFPRARHHLPRADWEWVAGLPAEMRDQYLPLLQALPNRVLDAPDVHFTPSVRSVGAAGHTPGHRVVVIESGGQVYCFLGDLVHNPPLHFAAPERVTTWDAQPELTPLSRRRIAAEAVAGDWLLSAAHGAFPPLGRLVADGDGRWTWRQADR